jgi:hypothetical protein
MAAIETIDSEDFINVEFKVGKSAVNGWSDVMAVQAFLKFFEEQYNGATFAPFAPGEVPEPNGTPDPNLAALILKYQRFANRDGNKKYSSVSEDGVVGRAKGKSSWRVGKLWTIADMNYRATVLSLAKASAGTLSGDHIKDLFDRFPLLRIAIGTPGVTF